LPLNSTIYFRQICRFVSLK